MEGILGGRKHFLLTIQAGKGFPHYEAPQSFLCNAVRRPQAESAAIGHFCLISSCSTSVKDTGLQPLL